MKMKKIKKLWRGTSTMSLRAWIRKLPSNDALLDCKKADKINARKSATASA